MTCRAAAFNVLALGLLLGMVDCSRTPGGGTPGPEAPPYQRADEQAATPRLEGTSWRLVEFRGGDETIRRPDDPTKYTIEFGFDGRLHARFDCNSGTGTWRSAAPPQLELGPLALTQATCPPGSLHDQLVKQWPYVRSYLIRGGHLFLSLMADAGIYELEPMSTTERH